MNTKPASGPSATREFLLAFGVLLAVLLCLFHKSFQTNLALFANDGPLGAANATFAALPAIFSGAWGDLIWIGFDGGSASPMPTNLIRMALGAIDYSKFYEPLSLLMMGVCAFYFFRVLTKNLTVSILAALAAMLNMNFFSNVCWGLGTRATCLGTVFIALGLAIQSERGHRWKRLAAAGLFVGLAVLEGADNGAIFSLYVAAFVVARAYFSGKAPVNDLLSGFARVAVIAVFAVFMAAQALSYLIPTISAGSGGPGAGAEDPVAKWDFATQWSLPKVEIIRVLIPGLFGYRMDTPDGGNYWGTVGRQPGWEQHHAGIPRYSGAGEYTGVLVLAIAAWAIARSFSRKKKIFNDLDRRTIWFWSACAIISVLFAFGRHAPFYSILYSLPYFSSIRNPIKLMHVFHLCAMVLFGYGLLDLYKNFILVARQSGAAAAGGFASVFRGKDSFVKKWALGSVAALGASALGFLIFASAKTDLAKFLAQDALPVEIAPIIADFAQREILLFLLFLTLSLGLVITIISGFFSGRRAKWAGICLGLLLTVDLVRSDLPWIQYYDYKEKYATNDLFEELRDHTFEHRVTARVMPFSQSTIAGGQLGDTWGYVYNEWIQHPFPFYSIQSLDFAQMPRTPAMDTAYAHNFIPKSQGDSFLISRLWQLTNCRYILGMTGFLDDLNRRIDPEGHRFRIRTQFDLGQERAGGPIIVRTNTTGQLALIDFTGALPRAKLYTQWQTFTNDQTILQQLAAPSFDPSKLALVSADAAVPAAATSTTNNAPEGTVEWVSYAPKKIVLKTTASTKSLLLLNDRHDPNWVARMDGNHVPLLRCNYIMRGAMVEAGNHEVVFSYEPKMTGLHVSLAAIVLGVGLCGFLAFSPEKGGEENSPQVASPAPEPPSNPPNQTSAPAQPQQQKPQPSTKKTRP